MTQLKQTLLAASLSIGALCPLPTVFGASLITSAVWGAATQAEACTGARVTLCVCAEASECVKNPEFTIAFKGTQTYLPLPRLEVARTPATRARGLMGRAPLADDQGMLFVYPQDAPRAFWMKDTPSSLDIIFINAEGEIVSIGAAATPFDETPIPSAAPARYVLELAAGRAEALGLRTGTMLSLKEGITGF